MPARTRHRTRKRARGEHSLVACRQATLPAAATRSACMMRRAPPDPRGAALALSLRGRAAQEAQRILALTKKDVKLCGRDLADHLAATEAALTATLAKARAQLLALPGPCGLALPGPCGPGAFLRGERRKACKEGRRCPRAGLHAA